MFILRKRAFISNIQVLSGLKKINFRCLDTNLKTNLYFARSNQPWNSIEYSLISIRFSTDGITFVWGLKSTLPAEVLGYSLAELNIHLMSNKLYYSNKLEEKYLEDPFKYYYLEGAYFFSIFISSIFQVEVSFK